MKGGRRSSGGGGGGSGLFDRLLVPRVENYGTNNDITDTDAVCEYLRRNYKEYQRHKLPALRQQVERAVEAIARRGGVTKAELRLQAAERQHVSSRSKGQEGDEEGSSSGSDSGSGSDAESSDLELAGDAPGLGVESQQQQQQQQQATPGSGMNRSMMSLYGQAPRGEGAAADGDADGDAPAFAPPHVVAAAAARALKEEAAAKRGAAAAAGGGGGTSMDAEAAPPGGPASASGHQQQVQVEVQPAPSTSGRTGTVVKTKRGGGTTPAERAATSKRPRTAGGRGGGGSTVTPPKPVTYADLGGIEPILDDIRELIEYPLKHPEVYGWLGVEPPRGVLLHGPPGCGKTALANAIANECGVPFLRVSAPEVVSGMSGESEAKIRQLFQEAAALAPCIVFIDEIDAIAPKRETAQREMERRIVAQMLTCMDDLSSVYSQSQQPGSDGGDGGGANGAAGAAGAADGEADMARLLEGKHVVVIGATNRPDALDPALRRAGRFDREISVGIPSEEARLKILQVLARRLRLSGDFDFRIVAKRTPGFVGADLAALMKESAALAVKRIFTELEAVAEAEAEAAAAAGVAAAGGGEGTPGTPVPAELQQQQQQQQQAVVHAQQDVQQPAARGGAQQQQAQQVQEVRRMGGGALSSAELAGLAITMSDFEEAVPKVQPSVRREGFATTPDVNWDDVGSLGDVREELAFAITQPVAHPEVFEAMGLRPATGVLLFGPPGCGKTLVAKAAAAESGANFISIKGPELLNKYVGESERAVRQLFSRARAAAPCVLFFDEMDALAPRRGSDVNQSSERVVNQLLTEMDGIEGRAGVYLVAATNRPDMIDPALLRPGRLDKILYVPLPPPEGRASILRALTRRTPLAPSVDLEAVGASPALTGFSGADLAALVREACVLALKESLTGGGSLGGGGGGAPAPPPPQVLPHHFAAAMARVQPSVSRKDQRMYDGLRLRLRSARGHLKPEEEAPGMAGEATAGGGAGAPAPTAGGDDMLSADNGGGGDGGAPMEEDPLCAMAEFASSASLIARYFGSPIKAATAVAAAANQVLGAERALASTSPPAPARAASTSSPVLQAAALKKGSPAKAPAPLFVRPAAPAFSSGAMLMRQHSSKQG
ncbi:Ribosome biogenesis ATPase RIX7 isoform B [Micractinium conductrix]|uniref:Ribosome biogenesis ATPase RIX7 isoform B n=1 Tax=Micractinium conductrix TaxID=554055 RepID=A0A2P6VDQ1_9CHLO|nr:Ribosome biogenesis ATPase RIX7 isoform B [Micractinium conductrix]|eukprot:PSC72207.1 Ribosome biogenesis ATPase RIX7 isoform B [Micractinium conductrix]